MIGIFVMLVAIASIVTAAVVTVADHDLNAKTLKEKINDRLDKHIEKGGKHGEAAQKIKDKYNGDNGDPNDDKEG